MQLTPHFNLIEFACRSGDCVPDAYLPNVQRLAEQLEVLRDLLGRPIVIISGWRSASHNAAVKGAAKSQHLTASAADIRVAGRSPTFVRDMILDLIHDGKMSDGGVGLYLPTAKRALGWVHLDCGPAGRRWRG